MCLSPGNFPFSTFSVVTEYGAGNHGQSGIVLMVVRFADTEDLTPASKSFQSNRSIEMNAREMFKSKTPLVKEISEFIHHLVSQFQD